MSSEDFFESIEQQYKSNLPFTVYRKPNTKTIKAILQKDAELYFIKNFKANGFVFAPFDDKQDTVLIPSDKSELIYLENFISNPVEKSQFVLDKFTLKEKSNHICLIEKGIKTIKSGQLKKVVLSRHQRIKLSETSPFSIFTKLLHAYASAFVYLWYHPKVGLWLGATPETLLKIEGDCFSAMALAGTQQYKGTLDVFWDDKEKIEQQLVTDYIVKNLQSSVKKINLSKVKTIKAGNILHLKTKIFGTLKNKTNSFQLILKKLHPTPAVCGLPKEAAKQFILDNEKYNREFYTGFLGELNNISSELYVNLRCMQLKKYHAIIYAGGGITKDSNPESEWEETLNKAEIIKRVL